ncbi:MAG: hypothetical protein OXC58_07260 [Acidimicrobiaceae bacterium]|nr:hypothetical protein [Acidimicrobiaceae bacterium]
MHLLKACPLDQALGYVDNYVDAMCGVDVRRSVETPAFRNVETARLVLRSLARNVATAASMSALARDTATGETGSPLDRKTLPAFLEAFERVFLREDCPSWGFRPASRRAVRVRPKRFCATLR